MTRLLISVGYKGLRVRRRAPDLRPDPERSVARRVDAETLAQERQVEEAAQLGLRGDDGESAAERPQLASGAMQHGEELGARVAALAEIDDDADVSRADRRAQQGSEIAGRRTLHLDDDDRRRPRVALVRDLDHRKWLPVAGSVETSSSGTRRGRAGEGLLEGDS